jgi:hypothetical protein
MSLFPVMNSRAINKCKSLCWRDLNADGELDNSDLHQSLIHRGDYDLNTKYSDGFHGMCIRSTICWSDIKSRTFKITNAHKACKINVMSLINFNLRPKSFVDVSNKPK